LLIFGVLVAIGMSLGAWASTRLALKNVENTDKTAANYCHLSIAVAPQSLNFFTGLQV
jgi:hypothetical protein